MVERGRHDPYPDRMFQLCWLIRSHWRAPSWKTLCQPRCKGILSEKSKPTFLWLYHISKCLYRFVIADTQHIFPDW